MGRRRLVAGLLAAAAVVAVAAGLPRLAAQSPDPDVEEGVRLAVVRLVTDDMGLLRVPPLVEDRPAAVLDAARRATRAATVRRVWDDERQAERLAAVEASLATLLSVKAAPAQTYDDNRFTVTQWQSLRLDGARASVRVLAHAELRTGAQPWRSLPEGVWELELVRTEGIGGHTRGWRLRSLTPPPSASV